MKKAALFDLDGVVLDTESQYTIIWGRIGRLFHPEIEDFNYKIKGMTLVNIFNEFFPNDTNLQAKVTQMLDDFESSEMRYSYIPGALEYIKKLHAAGIKIALVTSSNELKMNCVRRAIPDFDSLFDEIVTSEKTRRSKPDPDCFLTAAQLLNLPTSDCVVFEDSKNGLRAGRAAEMLTIGVATTFPRAEIEPLADIVIDNFIDLPVNRFFQ